MRTSRNPFLVLCALSTLSSAIACATQARYAPDNRVDVYGKRSSPFTMETVEDLGDLGVPFRFHEVDKSRAANREMWRHVKKVRPELNRVLFPVVRVNGRLMFAPGTDQIEGLLRRLPPEE